VLSTSKLKKAKHKVLMAPILEVWDKEDTIGTATVFS
jgi:hypothetical protein